MGSYQTLYAIYIHVHSFSWNNDISSSEDNYLAHDQAIFPFILQKLISELSFQDTLSGVIGI